MKKLFHAHFHPLVILLTPLFLFYNRILFWGEAITGGDLINQFIPWRNFALSELAAGRLPVWNPYVFAGTPFLANIQTSLWYPFNLLHFFLPTEHVFSLSLVIHHAAAALGMYGFLYAALKHRHAALLGALVYAWSGFFITHAHDGHLIHVRAYAWIPFTLWTQMYFRTGRSWKPVVLTAVFLALMFYGGHTQIPLYIFYLLIFRAFWWGGYAWRDSAGGTVCLRPLLQTGCALIISVLISLPVLLPLYLLSKQTAGRAGGAEYAFAVSDSMPPAHTLTLLAPFFFGDPTAPDRESQFWLTRTGFHEICGYTGILPITISLLIWMRRKAVPPDERALQQDILFFALLGCGGVFFALGESNPLYALLYYGLPGWSYFRVPGRLLLLWIIGVSVCSARGWQLWSGCTFSQLREHTGMKLAVVCSVLWVVMTLILIASKTPMLSLLRQFEVDRTMETFSLPASSRLNVSLRLPQELFEIRYAWMLHSASTACLFLGLGWAAMWIQKRWKHSMVRLGVPLMVSGDLLLFSGRFIQTQPIHEWHDSFFPQTELTRFLQERSAGYRILCLDDAIGSPGLEHHPELRPNRLMQYDLETVRGYDPLILQPLTRWVNRLYEQPPDTPQGGLLLFPALQPKQVPQLNIMNVKYIVTTQELTDPFTTVWSEPSSPVKVYENPQCYDKLFFEQPNAENTITALAQNPQEIYAEVSCDAPNRLVFSQILYPGWRVEVNGEELPVDAFQDTFVSVRLPAGEHDIKFFYRQPWVPE